MMPPANHRTTVTGPGTAVRPGRTGSGRNGRGASLRGQRVPSRAAGLVTRVSPSTVTLS